ncbi:uncharacterized protein JCM10292_006456 [Rhodotorula paludigena]|uniref:uncharacterized protein n=1 Tax=Rhodotorula paludigena TaxID=86838 RepID=UPI003173E6D0
MASLPDLPAVTRLSTYVTRILGQNPGKFTLQGTNSYLIHHPSSPRLFLLDTTGPSSVSPLSASSVQSYTTHLRSALAAHPAQPARVTDVVLSHWHGDHVVALGEVLRALHDATSAAPEAVRVWKMPCAGGGTDAWKGEEGTEGEIEQSLEEAAKEGLLEVDEQGRRVRPLAPGQRFVLPGEGEARIDDAVELEVVHTPGHTSDSICLVLRTRASSSPSPATAANESPLGVFTADTILGHGTAVFHSLSAYLSSLTALLDLFPSSISGSTALVPLYPGHGDVVPDGRAKIDEYRTHRMERERQVVEALQAGIVGESAELTASELTERIYASTIPDSLKPAATHGLLLHLAKLQEEGRVERVPRRSAREEEAREKQIGEIKLPSGWDDGWKWIEGREGAGGRL